MILLFDESKGFKEKIKTIGATKLADDAVFEILAERSCQKIIQFENKEKKNANNTNEKK